MSENKEETLLKKYSDIARTTQLMHSEAARYYTRLDLATFVTSSVLGYMVGGGLFTSAITTTGVDNNMPIYISFGLLSVISSALSSISKKYKFIELAKDHTQASSNYQSIIIRIDFLLSDSKATFDMLSLEKDFEELQQKSPQIPYNIQSKYLNQNLRSTSLHHSNKLHVSESELQLEFQKRLEEKYKCIKRDVFDEELKKMIKDKI